MKSFFSSLPFIEKNLQLLVVICSCVSLTQAAEYYVAQDGQTPGDFQSWATAASNIQAAVDIAVDEDTVWIGAGRYTLPDNPTNYMGGLNVVYFERPLTLRGVTGDAADVIIDGENAYRPLAVRITKATPKLVVLEGITFCNGYALNEGGGILLGEPTLFQKYVTVVNSCIIRDNHVAWDTTARGGGMSASTYSRGLIISNSVFSGNSVEGSGLGGALYSSIGSAVSDIRIIDSILENNSAYHGGSIYGSMSTLFLDRCIIRNNYARRDGGGVWLQNPQVPCYVRHCLIYNNVAENQCAAFYWYNKQPLVLEHCTVTSNKCNTGVIRVGRVGDISGLHLNNTILYGNSPGNIISYPEVNPEANLYATNSCMESFGNIETTDCFTNAPGFRDFDGQDFRLAADSPCINAAIILPWVTSATLDLAGNPRIDRVTGKADLGCFEHTYSGSILLLR